MTKRKDPKDFKKDGRPTKYDDKIAGQILEDLTYKTIKDACRDNGIEDRTYYNWCLKHPEFFRLSTESRKIKAVDLFNKSLETLEELKEDRKDPSFKDCVPAYRLLFDGYLRLAGKANQNLFGDQAKNNVDVTVDLKDVDVPSRMTQAEWEKNLKE